MHPVSTPRDRLGRLSALVASLLAVGLLSACATDEVAAPRLLSNDASRGVSTAATWTWSGAGAFLFPASGGFLTAINDSGHVAGFAGTWRIGSGFRTTSSFAIFGPRFTDVVNLCPIINPPYDPITAPDYCYGYLPIKINNAGTTLVTGERLDYRPISVVIDRSGVLTRIVTAPLQTPIVKSLSQDGSVGGSTSILSFDSARAMIWKGGKLSDVTPSGWTGGVVNGIDATGALYGGSVYYRQESTRRELYCAWMHRGGVDLYRNCIWVFGRDFVFDEYGVTEVNARGDAIGDVYITSSNGRSFIRVGTFSWPVSDPSPTVDPYVSRQWHAISDKGRLVGTEPSSGGRSILVTKSPAGVVEQILDHGVDARPLGINSCGTIVGGYVAGSPPRYYYSRWTPSPCDK